MTGPVTPESPADVCGHPRSMGESDRRIRPIGKKSRRLRMALVSSSISIVIVGVAIWASAGEDPSHSRSEPRRSLPAAPVDKLPDMAVLDSSGLVRALPNVARAVSPVITNDVTSGKVFTGDDTDRSPADGQTFIWVSFNSKFGRYLRLSVKRSVDSNGAHADLLARRKEMANKHTSAGKYALVQGAADAITDVGDEAFILPVKEQAVVHPSQDGSARSYDIGGSYVCTRFRNVVISVFFEGADYSSSANVSNPVEGRKLTEATTRQYAIKLIEAIGRHLY